MKTIRQTIRFLCRDGGWLDGLVLFMSVFGGWAAIVLICSMYS